MKDIVTVESLQKALEISLAKERSLRKLWNEALDELVVFVPSTEKLEVCDPETKESWIVTTAKPEQWSMFLDCLDSWIVKMRRVLDETFPTQQEEQVKVSVDREQLSEFKKTWNNRPLFWELRPNDWDEGSMADCWLEEMNRIFGETFSQKGSLEGSGEPLNLALAFTDVKKKKGSGSEKK